MIAKNTKNSFDKIVQSFTIAFWHRYTHFTRHVKSSDFTSVWRCYTEIIRKGY